MVSDTVPATKSFVLPLVMAGWDPTAGAVRFGETDAPVSISNRTRRTWQSRVASKLSKKEPLLMKSLSGLRWCSAVNLVLLLVCTGWTPAQAEPVADFSDAGRWRSQNAEARGGYVEAGSTGRVRLRWETEHGDYLVLRPDQQQPIEAFREQATGTVVLRVFSPGTRGAQRVNLRLEDTKGETFQWRRRVDLAERGWHEVVYNVSPQPTLADSWGADDHAKQGTMVPPLEFESVVVDLTDVKQVPKAKRFLAFGNLEAFGQSRLVPVPKERSDSGAQPMLDAIDVELDLGNGLRLLRPGSDNEPILKLTNQAKETVRFTCALTREHAMGRNKRGPRRGFALKPGETATWALPFDFERRGVWWIGYTLRNQAGDSRRDDRVSLCVMEPAGPTPGGPKTFGFGICTHAHRWDRPTQRRVARAVALTGAKLVRGALPRWANVQPAPDRWNWSQIDETVKLWRGHNIKFQYLMAFTPEWATTGDPQTQRWDVWSRKMPKLSAWRNYARRMAQRYGDVIAYWEMWNEPGLDFFTGTADQYVRMMETAYNALKGVDPDTRVMTAGFASWDRGPEVRQKALRDGGQWFDILAWHKHGDFADFQQEIDGPMARLREKYAPDKPLYFTETGFPAPGGDTVIQLEQAAQVPKKMAFAWARGAIAYNWYELRNSGQNPAKHKHRYGMFTWDFYPNPAYPAYNNFVRLLRGKQFDQQFKLNTGQWVLGFKGENDYVLVNWSQRHSQKQDFQVRSDAEKARRVDLMGNTTPVKKQAGSYTMKMQTMPDYIVLEGVNRAPSLESK
jgi:hypothetical protein